MMADHALLPSPSTRAHETVAEIREVLADWVALHAEDDGAAWYAAMVSEIHDTENDGVLVRASGLAARKLGKADLRIGHVERRRMSDLRPGFDPIGMSVDQVARIGFVLASYHGDDVAFAERFETLCRTAEINELIAFYRGLPLYPACEHLIGCAREGVRSGMKPVFEAVAHHSPFPCEMFDHDGWNQMVLKALFIDSALEPIQGLDRRANPDLASKLVDYAHERWAAGRSVSPELWRCVMPFAGDFSTADVRRLSVLV